MPPDPESVLPAEPEFSFEHALRTEGLEPADEDEARDLYFQILLNDSDFSLLTGHHESDHSYAILYDSAATWDIPGTAELLAVHVVRDRANGTFRCTAERMPLMSLAQQWLVVRGCPPEATLVPPGRASVPADDATAVLEETLRASPAARYKLLNHYTYDSEPYESWVLLRDSHPASAGAPFRLFVETADLRAGTYTLREGAFITADAAQEWLEEREGPLPPEPQTARQEMAARPAVIPPRKPGGPGR